MRNNWILLTVILLAQVLAGCNQGMMNDVTGLDSPPQTDTQSSEQESLKLNNTNLPTTGNIEAHIAGDEVPLPSPTLDPIQSLLTLTAKENLVQRLGMQSEEIRLVSIESVGWSDASLGCPQPGKNYAQVITPGFRILFDVNGKHYAYHTDDQQTVVFCGIEEIQSLLDGETTESIALAKDDLAQRLGIPSDSITVVAVISQEFPANTFYCQTSKERISREESVVEIVGKTILLNAAGHRYEYHASGQTVVFCRRVN
jgi:hypothetical protein